jgi:hypothetical protein
MRKLLFPLALSAACVAGLLHTGVMGASELYAQDPPACGNSKCSGPSYCVYGDTFTCEFMGPDSCATKRCAFIIQH